MCNNINVLSWIAKQVAPPLHTHTHAGPWSHHSAQAGGSLCAGVQERGLFEEMQDDEVEVLQQMFFGVVLCALATLAAKGDLVYTSVFLGAAAAMTGYWLSDRGDRLMDNFFNGR